MGHAGEHDCDERCDEVCGCGGNMADYGLLGYVHPATPTTAEAVPVTVAGWADEDFEVPLEETYEAELFGWQAAADPERQAVTT